MVRDRESETGKVFVGVNRSNKVEWWSYFGVIFSLLTAGVMAILDRDTANGFQWIAISGVFGMAGMPR